MKKESKEELLALATQAEDGLLKPEAVLEFATDKNTSLHSEFEWDNKVAGHEYRLSQARGMIRLIKVYEPRVQRTTRALISLPSDRPNGGGYREVGKVLDRPDWVRQLIEDVRKRIISMRESHSHLPQLNGLWPRLETEIDRYLTEMDRLNETG